MTARIGSLCSGYGGLELGLMAVVGGSVAWHVEYDKHPSAVLAERFPGVPNYGDVTTTDWTQVEPVDWLTAGYPCQPFSHAGKRKGSADERHLWPAVADAVGVLRPRRVLLENVAGHVSLGLDAVLADLAALGYDSRWGVVRAADAGAPHNRARIFIVAADTRSTGAGRDGAGAPRPEEQARRGEPDHTDAPRLHHGAATDANDERCKRGWGTRGRWAGPADGGEPAPDADQPGQQGAEPAGRHIMSAWSTAADTDVPSSEALSGRPGPWDSRRLQSVESCSADIEWGAYAPAVHRWETVTGRAAPRPTEPGRTGERLAPRFVEWMQGLPDGHVTDVLSRGPALKCLGNGVVPQQAALAVRTLLSVEKAVA